MRLHEGDIMCLILCEWPTVVFMSFLKIVSSLLRKQCKMHSKNKSNSDAAIIFELHWQLALCSDNKLNLSLESHVPP